MTEDYSFYNKDEYDLPDYLDPSSSDRKPPKVDDPLAEFPPPSIDRLMKHCYVLIDTDTGELAWGDTYWDGWIYSNWLTAQREIHDTHYKVVRASDLPPESYSRTKDAIKKIRRTCREEGEAEFDVRKLKSQGRWDPSSFDGEDE